MKQLLIGGVVLCLSAMLWGAPAARADVSVQFLGTTTLVFDDGQTRIVTDGFVSRPSLGQFASGAKVETDTKVAEEVLTRAGLTQADAIFVAHAHFDHAMDVKYMANRLGARIYGSRSTRAVAQARSFANPDAPLLQPVPDHRIEILHDERSYRVGNFRVTAIYTPHGGKNRFPGELRPGFKVPARMRDYLANENYSFLIENRGVSALVVPGSNYLTGKLNDYRAQTVFLGVGGLNTAAWKATRQGQPDFIKDYWDETVVKVGAHTIVPVHWDNFFKKLDVAASVEDAEPFATPPKFVEDFEATMTKLKQLSAAHNANPERTGPNTCIHLMRKAFLQFDLNTGVTCETR